MLNRILIKKLNMKSPSLWLATWFGCGLIKKAPGTWGTLGGLPFGLALLVFMGHPALIGAIVLLFYSGYRAAAKFEIMTGEHDSGAIVVDEVVGIWITLLAAPTSVIGILLAFLFFRFFDIFKPWPISYFDRMPGAMGVMMDDVMAGFYAAFCLGGLLYAGII